MSSRKQRDTCGEQAGNGANSNACVDLGSEFMPASGHQDAGHGEKDKGRNKAANGAPEEDVFAVAVDLLLVEAGEGVKDMVTMRGIAFRAGVGFFVRLAGDGDGRVSNRQVISSKEGLLFWGFVELEPLPGLL